MQQAWHRKNVCAEAANSGWLASSHVSRDPGGNRGLRVHRTEELVRATSSSRAAVAGREIVTEDVRTRDLMFLEQPADQRCGSGGLRRSERIGFAPDVFDADGSSVGAHTMIRAISVIDHLVDVTVAINDVVRGNFPRIGSLKLRQRTGQRSFRAMQNNFVDLCSDIAGGTIRAAGELFDDRFAGRRSSIDRRSSFCALYRFHRYRS